MLLVLAWLNVVLQPCAMAMADAMPCPDFSPVHIHEQINDIAAEGHARAMSMPEDPGRRGGHVEGDMGSVGEPCAGRLIDCVNLEDINQAARQEQSAPESGLVWIIPETEQNQDPYDHGLPRSFRLGDAARLAGASPPLNVLYCVYLD